jgi:hypothetical protein
LKTNYAAKILIVNILVLLLLLLGLEFGARLLGVKPLAGTEEPSPRYRSFCRRVAKEKLVVYNKFYTDSEGIFKARPNVFKSIPGEKGDDIINQDGFRGNDFKYVQTPATKIFLAGDSFTWGATAEPVTNSFACLLQAAGYYIYNAGIPGTGPAQYQKLVEKYVPVLKPDIVAVCLYVGNDLKPYPDPLQPGKNLHFITNFGFLNGYDERGNFFRDAEDVVSYVKKRFCGYCTNPWDYFLYKTVAGKAIFNVLSGPDRLTRDSRRAWVREALEHMRDVCRENQCAFMVFIIPARASGKTEKLLKKYGHVFEGFDVYIPEALAEQNYHRPPNNHFNNSGHGKFADFMVKTLSARGFLPVRDSSN